MVDSITLDPNLFSRHIEDLVKGWTGVCDSLPSFPLPSFSQLFRFLVSDPLQKEKADVSTADALFVVNGRESSNHSKTRAFQSWLFCYELTDTLIAITREKKVTVYCASLKGMLLFKVCFVVIYFRFCVCIT
jgi:hypothetical protein